MVIDTSIFIDFLRRKDKKETALFSISNEPILSISVITLYELMMGATNNLKKKEIQMITEDLIILDLDK